MDTQPITCRLPEPLYEWLRREAFDTREPMNAIVITALEELRARREAGAGMDQLFMSWLKNNARGDD